MTEMVRPPEEANNSKGSTFRRFLSIHFLPTIVGMLGCHLSILLIYFLLKTILGSSFFGTEIRFTSSVLLGGLHSLLSNFLIRIIPFSIILALFLALLSLYLRSNISTWKEGWRLGWVSYLLLSNLLFLRFPGVLISVPVVQSLPIPYWLWYLVLLSVGAVLTTLLPGRNLSRFGLLILLLLVTFLPHGTLRNAYYALHGKVLPSGRTEVPYESSENPQSLLGFSGNRGAWVLTTGRGSGPAGRRLSAGGGWALDTGSAWPSRPG